MLKYLLIFVFSFSTTWAADIVEYSKKFENVPHMTMEYRGLKINTSEQQLKDACNNWLQKQLSLLSKANSVILESRCSDIWTAYNDKDSLSITGMIYFK